MSALEWTENRAISQLPVKVGSCLSATLSEELLEVIRQGFIERNGCVVLRSCVQSEVDVDPTGHFDATGYECFVNHIHVDLVEGSSDPFEALRQAVCFAEELAYRLKEASVEGPFRLIVTFDREDHGCTVRFHRAREGQKWLQEDLESYAEGVMTTLVRVKNLLP